MNSYGLDGPSFKSRQGQRDYLSSNIVDTGSGAHPTFYAMNTGGSLLGVKRSGRQADTSRPSMVEVKNGVTFLLSLYASTAWAGTVLHTPKPLLFNKPIQSVGGAGIVQSV